jgi:hypothetical protein
VLRSSLQSATLPLSITSQLPTASIGEDDIFSDKSDIGDNGSDDNDDGGNSSGGDKGSDDDE